jgi:hypothetical protein
MFDKTKVPDKTKTPDKLDKLLAGGDITLNCLISDEGVNDIFKVTISNANNNRVSSLAEAIKTRRPDWFQDIDSTSLDLYKAGVGMLSGSVVIHKSQNSSAVKIEGGTKMELQDKIYSHFSKQPQLKFPGQHYEQGINVIVHPEPLPEVLSKDK